VISVLELVASSRGGGAVHLRDLTRYLDSRRFAVTVAMSEDGGNVTAADFIAHGISFSQLGMTGSSALTAPLQLRGLLVEKDCVILHCHGARAAFYGRVAAALLGSSRPRIVYTIHGFATPHYSFPRREILLAIERVLAPITDTTVCVSEEERKALLAALPRPPEQVRVVRNGIDTAQFANLVVDRAMQRTALRVPVNASLLTTVCRLYRPRDFDTLLRAFATLRAQSPDVHLLIVGDGPYRPRVEGLINRLGLTPNVTLAGFRRDVSRILAVSNIFVLSTALWEGLPLTILEAMASGLPVVASDVAGISEAVIHQETGLLVPPRDPAALFEALLDLTVNEQKAGTMGRRGRARAEASFTVERMTRETTEIYESLTTRD